MPGAKASEAVRARFAGLELSAGCWVTNVGHWLSEATRWWWLDPHERVPSSAIWEVAPGSDFNATGHQKGFCVVFRFDFMLMLMPFGVVSGDPEAH